MAGEPSELIEGLSNAYKQIADLKVINADLLEALTAVLRRDQRNTCQHDETHRGGVLWTICDACGAKWADDEGGKPDWEDPPEWTAAYAAIAKATGGQS